MNVIIIFCLNQSTDKTSTKKLLKGHHICHLHAFLYKYMVIHPHVSLTSFYINKWSYIPMFAWRLPIQTYGHASPCQLDVFLYKQTVTHPHVSLTCSYTNRWSYIPMSARRLLIQTNIHTSLRRMDVISVSIVMRWYLLLTSQITRHNNGLVEAYHDKSPAMARCISHIEWCPQWLL